MPGPKSNGQAIASRATDLVIANAVAAL